MHGQDAIAALGAEIATATRIALFTGAGISTESGIPDFRGPGGLWTRNKPIEFSDFLRSEDMRREAWRRKFATDPTLRAARPNRGHRACAHLVGHGLAGAIITQNIDGLHQASGIPEERVIELHGNATFAHCLECGERYGLEPLRAAFERDGEVPDCACCGGLVKSATVSFGQAMPEGPMLRAREEALSADLFLVLGSSLVVHPAAGFPDMAKQAGAALVIVNNEPTPLDDIADLVIRRPIGLVMGNVVGLN